MVEHLAALMVLVLAASWLVLIQSFYLRTVKPARLEMSAKEAALIGLHELQGRGQKVDELATTVRYGLESWQIQLTETGILVTGEGHHYEFILSGDETAR
ncbi:hypothetical protein [Lacticaseibacillus yichunensis]|uniref:Competence protein ComGE n=1 Tax=Lacticaseibacillus yichunensis TaxID=2486015 RepID=A0ABW4CPE4_9LACO|nr:hypothetical protein [Lacticaseibacillus yichunensis]